MAGVLLLAIRYSSSTGMPHSSAAPNSAAPIGLSSRWSMPLRLPSTDSFGLLWASTPLSASESRGAAAEFAGEILRPGLHESSLDPGAADKDHPFRGGLEPGRYRS
jgi:hypothetical protein